MQRPDLNGVDPTIVLYIEYLENQIKTPGARTRSVSSSVEERVDLIAAEAILPAEPPTTLNIITASRLGIAKRTHRHWYNRQHRGGMGIFDLELDDGDWPVSLTSVDDLENLLLFTNRARVFRFALNRVVETPVRGKGESLFDRLPLEEGERLVTILPERSSGYVALVSAAGRLRSLRHHLFGEHMKPGASMVSYQEFGELAGACWTPGDGDLLTVTRHGMAIRFSEKLLPPQGDWAIRLANEDQVVSVTAVYDDSDIFVLGADGKGTLRSMTGFAANKSMGGSGKQLIKNAHVVKAGAINLNDDLFLISRLGKIIRFRCDEIPLTDGVIQGVICMTLRGDEVMTFVNSGT